MTSLPAVIVLGVDTPIGLTVIRELGERGVPVHAIGRSAEAIGGASRWATGFSTMEKAPLADWLPKRIHETGAKALFAISEGELLALAELPAEIEGCRILTPRSEPLAIVLDKSRTLEVAKKVGIAVPECWQPMADEDFVERLSTLSFPLIAKWADPPSILPLLEKAKLPFLKTEHFAEPVALRAMLERYSPLGQWPLVQGFCPGEGLGQMLHMAAGKATLSFQHRRVHEWPPEGGTSTLCEALHPDSHPDQLAKSEALLVAIGWEGPAMVEYRHDPATGQFWLMEINGRFWGSLPLAYHAGTHFAWEQYIDAFPEVGKRQRSSWRYRKARFMIPETRRLIHILRSGAAEGRTIALWRFLAGFVDPTMRYYVWQWRDPKPMLRDLAGIVRKVVRPDSGTQAP